VVIRIRYEQRGGHIWCRVFTALARNQTFANSGELIFTEREWPEVKEKLVTIGEVLPEDQEAAGAPCQGETPNLPAGTDPANAESKTSISEAQ
jgi:hypothetical protein